MPFGTPNVLKVPFGTIPVGADLDGQALILLKGFGTSNVSKVPFGTPNVPKVPFGTPNVGHGLEGQAPNVPKVPFETPNVPKGTFRALPSPEPEQASPGSGPGRGVVCSPGAGGCCGCRLRGGVGS